MQVPARSCGAPLSPASCFRALAPPLFVILALALPAVSYSAPPAGTLSLAVVLPRAPGSAGSQDTDFFTGKSGNRSTYNAELAATGALIFSDDSGLYKSLQGSHENKSLTDLGHDFNHLGDLAYVGPALGLVYLSGGKGNRRMAWQAGVAIIKAGVIGEVLKEAVGRKRPDGRDGGDGSDRFKPFSFQGDNYQSFPSGHSLVAFSVATVWARDRPHEKYVAYGLA